VRVDGHFNGRMYTEDLLEVGTEGRVEGELDVARAVVSGTVNGKLRVREHLLIESTGRVDGVVDTAVLEVRPGATISATVRSQGGDGG
jgi:cytoskeletal protein CcmA (bactofilin family)